MASLTIQLDEEALRRLKEQAARNGRGVEEEASETLLEFAQEIPSTENLEELKKKGLGTAIHELFAPLGGVEVEFVSTDGRRSLPVYK